MSVQCVNCAHFSLKNCPAAHQGFGTCQYHKAYQSARYERQCAKYNPAPADTATARLAWLEKQTRRAA